MAAFLGNLIGWLRPPDNEPPQRKVEIGVSPFSLVKQAGGSFR